MSYTPSLDECGEQFGESRVRRTYDAAASSFTELLDTGADSKARRALLAGGLAGLGECQRPAWSELAESSPGSGVALSRALRTSLVRHVYKTPSLGRGARGSASRCVLVEDRLMRHHQAGPEWVGTVLSRQRQSGECCCCAEGCANGEGAKD